MIAWKFILRRYKAWAFLYLKRVGVDPFHIFLYLYPTLFIFAVKLNPFSSSLLQIFIGRTAMENTSEELKTFMKIILVHFCACFKGNYSKGLHLTPWKKSNFIPLNWKIKKFNLWILTRSIPKIEFNFFNWFWLWIFSRHRIAWKIFRQLSTTLQTAN